MLTEAEEGTVVGNLASASTLLSKHSRACESVKVVTNLTTGAEKYAQAFLAQTF